jgi:hypothetical protein
MKTKSSSLLPSLPSVHSNRSRRAPAAEFPDNPDYKSRLAALLKLQSQHFEKKDGAGPADGTDTKSPEKTRQ